MTQEHTTDRDPVDAIMDRVRAEGGRATMTRRAMAEVLIAHRGVHPTADHITGSVRRIYPDIAESTVYRFLDDLVRLDVIRAVRLGPGPAVFHFTEDARHHHLACEICGRVIEASPDVLRDVREMVHDRYGFVIDPAHLTFVGRCATCADAPEPVSTTISFSDHTHDAHTHDAIALDGSDR